MTAESELLDKGILWEDDSSKYKGTWEFAGEFGSQILVSRELNDYEQRFFNIGTSASITGFVRAYLFRAINVCSGVLYCDTDSIAARSIGDIPNGFGDELGQWEKEGSFKSGAFCGRKLYTMEFKAPKQDDGTKKLITHKKAHKGVRLDVEQIYEIAKGAEILYEPEAPVFSIHKAPHFINRTVKMNKKVLIDE